jgi:hypothetical protein
MPVPTFPLRAVAALFLERQHLARPRTRRLTPRRLIGFVEDAGGLQLDSINDLDRAHWVHRPPPGDPAPQGVLVGAPLLIGRTLSLA